MQITIKILMSSPEDDCRLNRAIIFSVVGRGGQAAHEPSEAGSLFYIIQRHSTPRHGQLDYSPEVAESYEEQHVHTVYESIASHFSSTRYKPWPIVSSFLTSLPPGSLGLDIGCGNGKYLSVNRDIFIVGSDRSSSLVKIAAGVEGTQGQALVADTLALPHQKSRFDFAICIAVVHHLSTRERRQEAVGAVLETLREGGKALIYVWALEQKS
ncbi:tRNA (carboxymethyluridine(34)-5-O)-methyltransferase, partial [Lachnellula suecica]